MKANDNLTTNTIVYQNDYNISGLTTFRLPLWKRLFDILAAGTALLLLSPLLLIIIVLIKLDSKGPIFYISKRVGTGYKIFDFYKFRSMRVDADKELDTIDDLNQYNNNTETIDLDQMCEGCDGSCLQLFMDIKFVCENIFNRYQKETNSDFVKIKNDPRITKLGRFLRNTSIDELPQLLNILKGDMSVVGNRPLPLYEAEQLTTDDFSQRFMAPAGLTGLWQVRKRGQGEMSAEERKKLDNEYAQNFSFKMDVQLIYQTLFVFIQKENV
jgi:lipopolysaccharide/colanic/teichoic acid biosynthesis glycosyltransferase